VTTWFEFETGNGLQIPNAIAIPFVQSVATSPADVAGLIRSAIETARVTRGLNVSSVVASRRVNLVGANVIANLSAAPSLSLVELGDSVHVYQNIIDLAEHTVTNPGPLGFEMSLAGDSFGAFTTSGPQPITRIPAPCVGWTTLARESMSTTSSSALRNGVR